MPTFIIACRVLSLVAFAGPMLIVVPARRGARNATRTIRPGRRAPVVATFAASALFFAAIATRAGDANGRVALALAALGLALAIVGTALVLRARAELGAAWSLVPNASEAAGLVTTGPYRLVRHPIYLGLAVLAMGHALAFASWPAVAVVLLAVVPALAWRARAEEALLGDTFGERYARYRARSKMIIPYLL
jgi:protein-S-isoprenylcysteine O-methyltransferase Ste14